MSDDEGELEIFENQLNDNANERKIVVETADIENIERFTYLETSIRPWHDLICKKKILFELPKH